MTSQISDVMTQPYISYLGMHKSARVLNAVTSFYFPIYELSQKDFFTYYPVLGFVEALVYQTDEAVEANQKEKPFSAIKNPWYQRQNLIIDLLKERDLYHPLIEKELENLGKYYDLENQLMSQSYVTHEDVIKAAELRTSDARALHRILLQMAHIPSNEKAFEILWPLEVIADIQDDITQYKDDVEKNHYNTYHMFVKIYGKEAPNYLEEELDKYEYCFVERLSDLSMDEQKVYMKIVSQYQEEHSLPNIPEPILE